MHRGVPVVLPCHTPLTSWKASGSRRAVSVPEEGRRRDRSAAIVSSSTGIPGHRPSSTAPTAWPWLSPNKVRVMLDPKEFFTAIAGPFLRFPQGSSVGIQSCRSRPRRPLSRRRPRLFYHVGYRKAVHPPFGRYWVGRSYFSSTRAMRCRAFGEHIGSIPAATHSPWSH